MKNLKKLKRQELKNVNGKRGKPTFDYCPC
jgi:hypothetical protein